jgi:predicted glycosyltransferase
MARIVIYCQSLQGVGHFVRSQEIARHLANSHAVWFISGGRHIPSASLPASARTVHLPCLHWRRNRLLPVGSIATVEATMAARGNQLRAVMEAARPDVLMIEHFPFSKLAFKQEILELIAHARTLLPNVLILCSVRDYPLSNQTALLSPAEQEHLIGGMLRSNFDHILVHADPSFCRIEDSFPWMANFPVPVHYTGFVTQSLPDRPAVLGSGSGSFPTVIVSSGGLGDQGCLTRACLDAWSKLRARGLLTSHRLMIFSPLPAEEESLSRAFVEPRDRGIEIHPFSERFLENLGRSVLSISQAGYNTTMNILRLGVRSLLVPSGQVHDQWNRARRLDELGLCTLFDPAPPAGSRLAEAILKVLDRPLPMHVLDLEGGHRTALQIAKLLEG